MRLAGQTLASEKGDGLMHRVPAQTRTLKANEEAAAGNRHLFAPQGTLAIDSKGPARAIMYEAGQRVVFRRVPDMLTDEEFRRV